MKWSVVLVIGLLIAGCTGYSGDFSFEVERNSSYSITEYNSPYQGINFFSNRVDTNIKIMSNEGEVFQEWKYDGVTDRFNYPLILSGGSVIMTNFEGDLIKLDINSSTMWNNTEIGAHHDADMMDDNILTFTRDYINTSLYDGLVEDELLVEVSTESGEVSGSMSIYELLEEEGGFNVTYKVELFREIINGSDSEGAYYTDEDVLNIFHANTIRVLRNDYNDVFRKGTILLSLRNINTIVLIDYEEEELLWSWGHEELDKPHYPVMTNDGNVMVFDNGREQRNHTRILEVDPSENEVVWSYNEFGEEGFYSPVMGAAQPLDNGNVLITGSTDGKAFEIDREGNVVWEYETSEENRIYRFERFEKGCVEELFAGEKDNIRECY